MYVISDEIIAALGRQIQPHQDTMSLEDLKTFEKMCADLSEKEKEVCIVEATEKTKMLAVLKELYAIAVEHNDTSAEDIIDKIMSIT